MRKKVTLELADPENDGVLDLSHPEKLYGATRQREQKGSSSDLHSWDKRLQQKPFIHVVKDIAMVLQNCVSPALINLFVSTLGHNMPWPCLYCHTPQTVLFPQPCSFYFLFHFRREPSPSCCWKPPSFPKRTPWLTTTTRVSPSHRHFPFLSTFFFFGEVMWLNPYGMRPRYPINPLRWHSKPCSLSPL